MVQALTDRHIGIDDGIAMEVPDVYLQLLKRDSVVTNFLRECEDVQSPETVGEELVANAGHQPVLKSTKYGRCPQHHCVLYPHLHRHSKSNLWGHILLRCSLFRLFRDKDTNGKPKCWFCRKLTELEESNLPRALLKARQEIHRDVAWQLRNRRQKLQMLSLLQHVIP